MCCQYIKDDGDECGRDEEPFCHQHENSFQARVTRTAQSMVDEAVQEHGIASDASEDDVSDSSVADDVSLCQRCERRIERVVEDFSDIHHNPKKVSVEEAYACGCTVVPIRSEYAGVLPTEDVPDYWR